MNNSSAFSTWRSLPKASQDRVRDSVRRERARRHLFEFAKFTSPDHFNWAWHHALLYRYLDDFAAGRRKRIIVEMPPGHGKSEGVSRRLPAYLFGRIPGCRVIACSHTADLACEMARDVQQILDGEEYRALFPAAGLSRSKRARQRADLFDVAGGGIYKASGVAGPIGGRRFDRGIIDDPVKDREEANSPVYREKTWRWFTSVFHKRQAKDAGILITSTRWHEDDLVGRLKRKIATGESEPYDILTLPAIATDRRHPDDPRKPGEAIWPWFRPAAVLEKMRLLEPRDFYALEQQDPRAEGGVEWDAVHFPPSIWFDDWPKADDMQLLVAALDPSKGRESKSGDYSAFVALGRDHYGGLWCEADLIRQNPTALVEYGLEFWRKIEQDAGKQLEGFCIETDQFQQMLEAEFKRRTRETGQMNRVYGLRTMNVPKPIRIRRLSGEITSQNIRFRNTPGTRELVRQLQEFPVGDYDDGPDALEYAQRLMRFIFNGKPASERKTKRRN